MKNSDIGSVVFTGSVFFQIGLLALVNGVFSNRRIYFYGAHARVTGGVLCLFGLVLLWKFYVKYECNTNPCAVRRVLCTITTGSLFLLISSRFEIPYSQFLIYVITATIAVIMANKSGSGGCEN